MPSTWLSAAEVFADGIREHGEAAADLTASVWQARVDPDATRSLLDAAAVLTGGDAVARAWERVPACPNARAFLNGVEEIQGECVSSMRYAQDIGRQCADVHDAAAEEYQKARHARDRAAREDSDQSRVTVAAAEERMTWLSEIIADTEAALEKLDETYGLLHRAVLLLPQVEVDFADACDIPLQHIRDGGTLPWSGHFITATPDTTGKAA